MIDGRDWTRAQLTHMAAVVYVLRYSYHQQREAALLAQPKDIFLQKNCT